MTQEDCDTGGLGHGRDAGGQRHGRTRTHEDGDTEDSDRGGLGHTRMATREDSDKRGRRHGRTATREDGDRRTTSSLDLWAILGREQSRARSFNFTG